MEPAWNSTAISMIPKNSNAETVADYRPISLCNAMYKVVAKLLANRLQHLLPLMIQPNQTAFIKERQIVHNVLLASEMVCGYNNAGISRRGMLKVDLQKAFDSIEWSFILDILKATNFPPRFILWVSQCIKTTRFSIVVNGELCGYFKGTKGLRQGDPLSPYLFVIGVDIFSRLLDARFNNAQIGFHPKAMDPAVTHLIFADDIMIFFDGHLASVFANQSGFTLGNLPVKYLGLPLIPNMLSRKDCEPLIIRIKDRILSWQFRHLSYAGRTQLISAVIQNIISYWCAAFILAAKVLKDIEKICRRFLWSGASTTSRHSKVAWDQVCSPKKVGGLGLLDLKIVNIAYGLKLIWTLFSNSGSLWVAWCYKYRLRRICFWGLKAGSVGASTWKQMLKLRNVAKDFLSCVVGNGLNCSFWFDRWTPFGDLFSFLGENAHCSLGIPLDATVASVWTGNGWDFRGARSDNCLSLLCHLTSINLSSNEDMFLWRSSSGNPMPKFSLTDTRNQLLSPKPLVSWYNSVWFTGAVPKQSFTVWLACLDKLPTLSRICSWDLISDSTCFLCEIWSESRDHLFLWCPYTVSLWRWFFAKLQLLFQGFSSWEVFLSWLRSKPSNVTPSQQVSLCSLMKLIAHELIYTVWGERNARIFNSTRRPAEQLIPVMDKRIRNVCSSRRSLPKFQHCLLLWLRDPLPFRSL